MSEEGEETQTKRVADLDDDDTMKRVQVMMPQKWYKRLGEIAVERECSRGSIVREALRNHFKKIEKPSNLNPKDEELSKILGECSTFFGGFDIEDAEGFIETMMESELKLKDLTAEQWKRVQEKLLIGYAGYISPPKGEEFAEKFDVLEPTEEQRVWLLEISSTDEDEENEEY